MNKRFLCLFLLLSLLLSLCACSKKETPTARAAEEPIQTEAPAAPEPLCAHEKLQSVYIAASCAEAGKIEYVCDRCGACIRSDTLSAPGHSFRYESNENSHRQVCSRCGAETEAAAHSFFNGICSLCGYGCQHSYRDSVTAPGCTAGGCTTHVCALCGYSYTDSYTAPGGHSYQLNVRESNCTEAGAKTYVCALCGSSYTEPLPPLGHHIVTDPAVAPTCAEAGHTEGSHCSRCGAVIIAPNTIPATGAHEYVDGFCAHCGAPESTPWEDTDGGYELPEDLL